MAVIVTAQRRRSKENPATYGQFMFGRAGSCRLSANRRGICPKRNKKGHGNSIRRLTMTSILKRDPESRLSDEAMKVLSAPERAAVEPRRAAASEALPNAKTLPGGGSPRNGRHALIVRPETATSCGWRASHRQGRQRSGGPGWNMSSIRRRRNRHSRRCCPTSTSSARERRRAPRQSMSAGTSRDRHDSHPTRGVASLPESRSSHGPNRYTRHTVRSRRSPWARCSRDHSRSQTTACSYCTAYSSRRQWPRPPAPGSTQPQPGNARTFASFRSSFRGRWRLPGLASGAPTPAITAISNAGEQQSFRPPLCPNQVVGHIEQWTQEVHSSLAPCKLLAHVQQRMQSDGCRR